MKVIEDFIVFFSELPLILSIPFCIWAVMIIIMIVKFIDSIMNNK